MIKLLLTENEKNNIKKILVIQTAFIGDAILCTTIYKGIKKILPHCSIDVLAIPQTSNLFQNNPHISNVYEFDKREFKKRIYSFLKIQNIIRVNKYDAAISIQSSLTSSILMLLGMIKIRIGYPRQKLLTHSIKSIKGLHLRKRVLRLLEPLGGHNLDDQTELYWGEGESERIDEILNGRDSSKFIAIAPGSAQFTKQWPKEYFASLIKSLEQNGWIIFLIGGKEDRTLSEEIIESKSLSSVNLAGDLSILESAALISKMDLVISNDSAPLHIANAVQTDVFAIFGPTVKDFGFYPYRDNGRILEVNLDCRPCGKHGGDKCPLEHFKCMVDLTPEQVYKEVVGKFST